jgi:predicted Zn finger-like uncharacterized protein
MIVECPSCHARFRLDESLFQGSKGIRIRCRKCGEGIAVLNPESAASLPEEEPIVSTPEATAVTDSFPPQVPSPIPPTGKMTDEEETPQQPLDEFAPAPPFHKRPAVIAVAFLVLLIAGGVGYFGFTASGQEALERLVYNVRSKWLGGAAAGPLYDIQKVTGEYEINDVAGKLFVIKGQVANVGRTRTSGIRVHAALLDGKRQPMAERTCYAGNILTGETLRTATREKIEEALSNRFGDRLVNMDVPPGKSLPFMVVFFDPPGGIDSFRVRAIER